MVLVQQHSRALLFRQRLNGAADDFGAGAGHQLLFDTGSPAFTSIMSWTSDLAIASTLYRTHWEVKSCTGRVFPAAAICCPAGHQPKAGESGAACPSVARWDTGENIGTTSETFGVAQTSPRRPGRPPAPCARPVRD